MAVKFNPATGQTEDDGQSTGPGLYDHVADAVGTIFAPAGAAMKVAPALLEEGAPPAPDPTATPPPVTPSPAAPAPTTPAPPATAESPEAASSTLPPEIKTVTKTPEITRHLTNQEELRADKGVAAATAAGEKVVELENANRLKQAEIDQAKLDVEHRLEKQRAENAAKAEAEATRRKAELDAQAKRDQDAYQAAAAAGDKGFWGDPSVPTRNQWALSLMFGNVAEALGGKNVGRELLDKNMAQWTAERDKKLARLERQAEKSGGLAQKFWSDYRPEYEMRKQLQDAAAYTTVADQWEAINEKQKALIPAQAYAQNARGIAEYRQKAAEKRQAVVDQRFGRDQIRSGGTETTVTIGKPAPGAGQGRAATAAFNAARIAEHAGAALKTIDELAAKGIKLTDEDRIRIQENKKEMEKDKHSGYLEGKVMRGLHMVARTPFDGLSTEKRNLAQAEDVLMQKAAVLAAGGSTASEAIDHARSLFDVHSPGISPETRGQIIDQIRGIVGANRALGGNFSKTAQAGADAAVAGKPAPAAGGGQRKLVNGKPAIVYPDGTYEAL